MADQHDLKPTEDELRAVSEYLKWYWRVKRGRSLEDAEDAAQQGVLKALLKAPRWRGKSSLLTFLIRVGINAGLDHFKKENRHRRFR